MGLLRNVCTEMEEQLMNNKDGIKMRDPMNKIC